jgi:hypothetical protein
MRPFHSHLQACLLSPTSSCLKLTVLTGEAVTLFGTSGPSNGPYSVQLDGGPTVQYNASNAYPTNYGVTIYHADNLGPGTHQIVLTNLPDTSSQYVTIDYAQLWTIASTSTSQSAQNNLSSGAIVGLVVEAVVAVLAAAAAFFYYRRWRVALTTPHTSYFPLHRSPETTTATATGIAPSLETWSNPNSRRNDAPLQPLAAVGRSPNGAVQDNTSSQAPNEGQAGLPGGHGQISVPGGTLTNDPPPGYDTAVRSAPV